MYIYLLVTTSNLGWLDDVVDLEYHFDELGSQKELLTFRNEWVIDVLQLHISSTVLVAVDTDAAVGLGQLLGFDRCKSLDGSQTRVASQCDGDGVQSGGKCTDGVLLDTGDLLGLLGNGKATSNFSGTASVNYTIVSD